jgi:hypothetical protein
LLSKSIAEFEEKKKEFSIKKVSLDSKEKKLAERRYCFFVR